MYPLGDFVVSSCERINGKLRVTIHVPPHHQQPARREKTEGRDGEEKRFVCHSVPTHYYEIKDATIFHEGQHGASLILLVLAPAFTAYTRILRCIASVGVEAGLTRVVFPRW